MNKIKIIKIALMNEIVSGKDTADFDLTYAGVLDIETILNKNIGNVTEDNYDEFIAKILLQIYDNLSALAIDNSYIVDSIGLWIDNGEKILDNSIKISILDDIKKYGADDINPIYEFYKMTIGKTD